MFESFANFLIEWAQIIGAILVVGGTVYGAVKVVQYWKIRKSS